MPARGMKGSVALAGSATTPATYAENPSGFSEIRKSSLS